MILASLRKLESLDVDTIFCSVAGAISSGSLALQRKISFMENLQETVWKLYRQGMPPAKIRSELLGKEGTMYYVSGGHFAKQNLVNSILGIPSLGTVK